MDSVGTEFFCPCDSCCVVIRILRGGSSALNALLSVCLSVSPLPQAVSVQAVSCAPVVFALCSSDRQSLGCCYIKGSGKVQ